MNGITRTMAGGTLAVLAAVVFASVGPGAAAQPTGAGPCSVTPVFQADVAVGAAQSLDGGVTIPVTFAVTGSCSARQFGEMQWTGVNGNGYVTNFGYHASTRPQLVILDYYSAGPVQVSPAAAGDGFVEGSASFHIRYGAWLGEQPGEQPRNGVRVQAQHWDPRTGLWAPLSGRVYLQKQVGGRWSTLRTAQLDSHGRAVLVIPHGQDLRFIVPGTAEREPAVLLAS